VARVTVNPENFEFVDFDAPTIAAIAERVADQVGIGGDDELTIDVDESVPLSRVRIASTDPIVLDIEGSAFEDAKRIRQFDEQAATRVLGRLLFQVLDLRTPGFGEPAPRDELSFPLRVAWDTYATGRVARLGYDAQRQRWLYAFRTRHGFTDEVDRIFDLLWNGDGYTWADLERLSAEALAAGHADAAATPSPAR
jgi:hypothetical protein